jgi:hypothetical protein
MHLDSPEVQAQEPQLRLVLEAEAAQAPLAQQELARQEEQVEQARPITTRTPPLPTAAEVAEAQTMLLVVPVALVAAGQEELMALTAPMAPPIQAAVEVGAAVEELLAATAAQESS